VPVVSERNQLPPPPHIHTHQHTLHHPHPRLVQPLPVRRVLKSRPEHAHDAIAKVVPRLHGVRQVAPHPVERVRVQLARGHKALYPCVGRRGGGEGWGVSSGARTSMPLAPSATRACLMAAVGGVHRAGGAHREAGLPGGGGTACVPVVGMGCRGGDTGCYRSPRHSPPPTHTHTPCIPAPASTHLEVIEDEGGGGHVGAQGVRGGGKPGPSVLLHAPDGRHVPTAVKPPALKRHVGWPHTAGQAAGCASRGWSEVRRGKEGCTGGGGEGQGHTPCAVQHSAAHLDCTPSEHTCSQG
jgi:hypothetical protein